MALRIVAVFVLSIWMSRTPFGYALKAIRNDEQAAEVVGIRIFPIKLQAMTYGAMAAAVAGAAYVWSFRYVEPRTVFGLDVALIPVAMALLGGSGLLWGPLRRGAAVGRHPVPDEDDDAVHDVGPPSC